MARRSRKWLLALAATGGLIALDSYRMANTFVPAMARVARIETLCMATSARRSGYTDQKPRTIAEQDCERVRELVANHRQYRDYRVIENTYVHYVYTSPIDGREHIGRQPVERPRRQTARIGEALPILVNLARADLSRSL